MRESDLIVFVTNRPMVGDASHVIIYAGSNEQYMKHASVRCTVDGAETSCELVKRSNNRVKSFYPTIRRTFVTEYLFIIKVTDNFRKLELSVTFDAEYGNEIQKYTISGSKYRKTASDIQGCIDFTRIVKDKLCISGWCAETKKVDFEVYAKNKPVPFTMNRVPRTDIDEFFLDNEYEGNSGYEVYVNRSLGDIYTVRFKTEDNVKDNKLDIGNRFRIIKKLKHYTFAFFSYLRKKGIGYVISKALSKLTKSDNFTYYRWLKVNSISQNELTRQRDAKFKKNPLYSILIFGTTDNQNYMKNTTDSISKQTYSKYEIITDCDKVKGDFIVTVRAGGILQQEALYQFTKCINSDEQIDFIYADEDRFTANGRKRCNPLFKPDFSIDLLRNRNYIGDMIVFSRELYATCGGYNSDFGDAKQYDLILRYTEKAAKIYHIPTVLYTGHGEAVDSMGGAAVKEHLNRLGVDAEVHTENAADHGYDIEYLFKDEKKVSIIIPNKDHTDDLDKCIKSIVEVQDYTNYEIVIVENNSTEDKTFSYYEDIQKKYNKVKVVYWKEEFNYSKINNFGVNNSTGEYLLFLNNDTEMINSNTLRQLVSFAIRPEVGIVGAKLFYGNDTIQHAGVVIGIGGSAGHVFIGSSRDARGYHDRLITPQDYSAVTAACMIVRKSIFDEVNGFEEKLAVAFNDVDFCLKVREKGYFVVYNPYAQLHHYESVSRGYEDTPEKKERFEKEKKILTTKWEKYYELGDPFYNINLSLGSFDFIIKEV